MKSLTAVIGNQVAEFIKAHNRKPSVIRLSSIHVRTLRACGAVSKERWIPPAYDGIPIEIVAEALHVSVD